MSVWAARIANATKYKDQWESTYHCSKLYDYYKGFQWKNKASSEGIYSYRPYTLNLVFSSIEIKLANLLFKQPHYLIDPRPGNSDWNQELAQQSAQIKQDVLNTLIKSGRLKFKANVKRAILDSFFRFGILEVGYAADWRNPAKLRPLFSNRDEEMSSEDKGSVVEDEELPENERVFFKRIKASRFLVSASDSEDIENCDWCGYYEFYYTDALKKNKALDFPKTSTKVDIYSSDIGTSINSTTNITPEVQEMLTSGAVSKVYHIFDNIAKKRKLILSGGDEIFETPFERLPFQIRRWDEPLEGFYPVPPVFHWLSSQDEINESREQMRSYRRRFTRKFQAMKGGVDEQEKEKFASGIDGEIIEVNREDAIKPITNPELGAAIQNALVISKDDFNIISGTSSEQRGQADRQTATQSKLIESRTQIRESNEQEGVKDFLVGIGREALLTAGENFAGSMWVKLTADPGDTIGEEAAATPAYQLIGVSNIQDGYDFEIDVDVINSSPLAAEEEKTKFLEFLSVVNTYPQVALSPLLIRECAYRVGYRNEKVIREMQRAAQLNLLAQAQAAQGGQGGQPNPQDNASNAGKAQLAQEQPNSVQQTETQLQNQLGVQ